MNPYAPTAASPTPYRTEPIMVVNERAVELLRLTRPWVLLLSVLLFLGCGLMLLAGIGMAVVSLLLPGTPSAMGLVALIYVPLAGVYVYPAIKLWSYGSSIAALVSNRTMTDLERALEQQKSFWKYCGISAVVMIGVYILGFGVAIAVGVSGAMLHGGHP